MRSIIVIVLALVCGFGLYQIDRIDPDNYIKLYVGNYLVEIKLFGFILLCIALVVALYFVLSLVMFLWRSPKVFGRWRKQKGRDKAEQNLGAGYLSLIKGDWKKAEAQLTASTSHIDVPYVNYLAAAQAAQQQNKVAKRDEYLQLAYDAAPKEVLAIGMTKARLHQQAGQYQQALDTLLDVSREGDKNAQYTAMLIQTYESLGQWDDVQSMLAKAKKQKALPDNVVNELQASYFQATLSQSDDKSAAWAGLPRVERKLAKNVMLYAQELFDNGEMTKAEKLIRETVKTDWHDRLINFYGRLALPKPQKALRQLEGWMMARPENAELALAAARMALQCEKTDVAKQYFQQAIEQGQLAEAYHQLGGLLESEHLDSDALGLYRSGLTVLTEMQEQVQISNKSE